MEPEISKVFTFNVIRTYTTQHKVVAKNLEEAERVLTNTPERILEESDYSRGNCNKTDIQLLGFDTVITLPTKD